MGHPALSALAQKEEALLQDARDVSRPAASAAGPTVRSPSECSAQLGSTREFLDFDMSDPTGHLDKLAQLDEMPELATSLASLGRASSIALHLATPRPAAAPAAQSGTPAAPSPAVTRRPTAPTMLASPAVTRAASCDEAAPVPCTRVDSAASAEFDGPKPRALPITPRALPGGGAGGPASPPLLPAAELALVEKNGGIGSGLVALCEAADDGGARDSAAIPRGHLLRLQGFSR